MIKKMKNVKIYLINLPLSISYNNDYHMEGPGGSCEDKLFEEFNFCGYSPSMEFFESVHIHVTESVDHDEEQTYRDHCYYTCAICFEDNETNNSMIQNYLEKSGKI